MLKQTNNTYVISSILTSLYLIKGTILSLLFQSQCTPQGFGARSVCSSILWATWDVVNLVFTSCTLWKLKTNSAAPTSQSSWEERRGWWNRGRWIHIWYFRMHIRWLLSFLPPSSLSPSFPPSLPSFTKWWHSAAQDENGSSIQDFTHWGCFAVPQLQLPTVHTSITSCFQQAGTSERLTLAGCFFFPHYIFPPTIASLFIPSWKVTSISLGTLFKAFLHALSSVAMC